MRCYCSNTQFKASQAGRLTSSREQLKLLSAKALNWDHSGESSASPRKYQPLYNDSFSAGISTATTTMRFLSLVLSFGCFCFFFSPSQHLSARQQQPRAVIGLHTLLQTCWCKWSFLNFTLLGKYWGDGEVCRMISELGPLSFSNLPWKNLMWYLGRTWQRKKSPKIAWESHCPWWVGVGTRWF